MPWSEPTYSLTLDVTGVRFYGSDARIISAEASTSAEVSVQVISLEILKPQIVISGEVLTSVSASKTAYASAQTDGLAISVVVSIEIVKALIAPSASVSMTVAGTKIAYSNSTTSSDLNVSASAIEILFASAATSGDVESTASAYEILYANSTVSGEVETSATALEILLANISTSVSASVSATALEILLGVIDIPIESNSTASSYKIAYSASAVAVESDLSPTLIKIAYSQSEVEATSSAAIVGTEILYAYAQTSGLVITVTVGKEILYINPQPTGAATVLSVDAIRFSPSIVEDVSLIRTLLLIDGKPLSEHNRKLSSTIVQDFVENTNWSSRKSRYYRSSTGRKTFNLNWTMLPSKRGQTVDSKFGRDKIKELAEDPDFHVLTVINNDTDGLTPYSETQYNVIIRNYSETLVRRDINSDMYLWDCDLQLEEI